MEEAPENGKESSHSAHANRIEQNTQRFTPFLSITTTSTEAFTAVGRWCTSQ
jgi:hypothetical protein